MPDLDPKGIEAAALVIREDRESANKDLAREVVAAYLDAVPVHANAIREEMLRWEAAETFMSFIDWCARLYDEDEPVHPLHSSEDSR